MPGKRTKSSGKIGILVGRIIIDWGPETKEGLTQLVQGRLHFISGMNVPRFLGDDDAVGKGSARFFEPPETCKELPEHFPARLLTLGHGEKHRIIAVRTR